MYLLHLPQHGIHYCFSARGSVLINLHSSGLRVQTCQISVSKHQSYIYIPHLPNNGGFQFAGVNLQNIFQFDTKNQKKYTQNELFGHTE